MLCRLRNRRVASIHNLFASRESLHHPSLSILLDERRSFVTVPISDGHFTKNGSYLSSDTNLRKSLSSSSAGKNRKNNESTNHKSSPTGPSDKQQPTQFFKSRRERLDQNEIFKPMMDQSVSPPGGVFTNNNFNDLGLSSFNPSTDLHLDNNDLLSNMQNSSKGLDSNEIMIDPSSMYNPTIHLPNKPNFNDPKLNYEPSTKLGEEIMKYIAVQGSPITVAEYMRRCLRDEQYGYYTNPPASSSSSNSTDNSNDDDDLGETNDSEKDVKDVKDVHDDTTIDDSNNNNFTKEGRGHHLIGQQGDFTTAPEISQIFGECIAVWLLTQYEALHKPKQIQLVELGPGRGTLMCDILRAAKGIKGIGEDFIDALCNNGNTHVSGVHFVEVSENLRSTQKEALMEMKHKYQDLWNGQIGFDYQRWETKEEKQERMNKLMDKLREEKDSGKEMNDQLLKHIINEQKNERLNRMNQNVTNDDRNEKRITINWHDTFDAVPYQASSTQVSTDTTKNSKPSIPTFIICQEFFDALPVHVFQKTQAGWRERLIDVAVEDEKDADGQVKAEMLDRTTASIQGTSPTSNGIDASPTKKKPRFRFVLSPDVTPAVKTLLRTSDDGKAPPELEAAPDGSVMEVSPESLALIQDLALRIDECQGAALIVDYGNEGSKDTLRAFRRHEQVDVLSCPGTVDVTADVDFTAMKNAINVDMLKLGMLKTPTAESNMTEAFGPKGQGEFLSSMGAVERTVQLIEDDNTTDDQAEDLCTALERLVSTEEMGERFKVLSIGRKKDGIFPPPAF